MTTVITQAEYYALRDACHGRDRLIVRLLAGTGLRVSELVALNVGDVRNADDGTMRLHVFKGRGNRRYDHDHQVVYLRDDLRADLLDEAGDAPDDRPLFAVQRHRSLDRLSVRAIQRMLAQASIRAGLPRVHPHSLRRYYVTRLMELGTGLHVTQALARHASPATTLRYAHPTTESKRAAAMSVEV